MLALTAAHPAPAAAWTGSAIASDIAAARAHTAFATFLAAYWDPRRRVFVKASGTRGQPRAAAADYWWQSQALEATLDAFEAGDPSATRALIDDIDATGLAKLRTADYNDDLSWWAMAGLRAYALTHDASGLPVAREIAAKVWQSWDPKAGGIWWRASVHGQKNVATNATAAIVNAQLYRITGGVAYRNHAVVIFDWLEAHLRDGTKVADHVTADGRVVDWAFTYNYGEYIGAARELASVTGDERYLGVAETVADAAMALSSSDVLEDEGAGDGGGFKGILVRQIELLAADTGIERYARFLEANAAAAWANRRSDGLSGPSWEAPPSNRPIQALTDLSAVRLFEQVALLHPSIDRPSFVPGRREVAV